MSDDDRKGDGEAAEERVHEDKRQPVMTRLVFLDKTL